MTTGRRCVVCIIIKNRPVQSRSCAKSSHPSEHGSGIIWLNFKTESCSTAQAFNYAPQTVYLRDDFATRCYLELRSVLFFFGTRWNKLVASLMILLAVGECRWCRPLRKSQRRIVAMSHVIQCCDCRLSHTHRAVQCAYYKCAYLAFCRRPRTTTSESFTLLQIPSW